MRNTKTTTSASGTSAGYNDWWYEIDGSGVTTSIDDLGTALTSGSATIKGNGQYYNKYSSSNQSDSKTSVAASAGNYVGTHVQYNGHGKQDSSYDYSITATRGFVTNRVAWNRDDSDSKSEGKYTLLQSGSVGVDVNNGAGTSTLATSLNSNKTWGGSSSSDATQGTRTLVTSFNGVKISDTYSYTRRADASAKVNWQGTGSESSKTHTNFALANVTTHNTFSGSGTSQGWVSSGSSFKTAWVPATTDKGTKTTASRDKNWTDNHADWSSSGTSTSKTNQASGTGSSAKTDGTTISSTSGKSGGFRHYDGTATFVGGRTISSGTEKAGSHRHNKTASNYTYNDKWT